MASTKRPLKQGPERDRRGGASPSAQAAQADRGGGLHPLRDAKAASVGEAEHSRSGLSCPCRGAMMAILFGGALMERMLHGRCIVPLTVIECCMRWFCA